MDTLELYVEFANGSARVVALDKNSELGRRRLDRLAFRFLHQGRVERCIVQEASTGRGKYRMK